MSITEDEKLKIKKYFTHWIGEGIELEHIEFQEKTVFKPKDPRCLAIVTMKRLSDGKRIKQSYNAKKVLREIEKKWH